MFASSATPFRAPDWSWDLSCDPAKPLAGQAIVSPEPGVAVGQINSLGGLMLMSDAATVSPNVVAHAAPPLPYTTTTNNNNRNLNGISGVSSSYNGHCVAVPAGDTTNCGFVQRKRHREDEADGVSPSGLLNSICTSSGRSVVGAQHQLPCSRDGFLAAFLRQQLLDVDALVTAHADKLRAEALESRRRLVARLAAAADTAVARRVRQKQDEIARIGQANDALEGRLRWVEAEALTWRDIAREREETAVALRRDLETAVLQLQQQQPQQKRPPYSWLHKEECVDEGIGADGDAQESCCQGGGADHNNNNDEAGYRRCIDCREDQADAVLLPCRHLCLCALCASRAQACPICSSPKQCSLLLNLSLPMPSDPS